MTANQHPGAGPGRSLRSLLAGAVAENLRLASRLNALAWERALRSPGAPRSGAPRSGAAELLPALLEGQLRSIAAVAAVLDDLAAPAATPAGRTPRRSAEAPPPAPVRLEAARGGSVTVPFAVENQYDHRIEVALSADPLVAPGCPAVPADVVSFDPPTAALEPGAHVVVRATVRVTERFAVGGVYSTTLRVREPPAAPLRVHITVSSGTP